MLGTGRLVREPLLLNALPSSLTRIVPRLRAQAVLRRSGSDKIRRPEVLVKVVLKVVSVLGAGRDPGRKDF